MSSCAERTAKTNPKEFAGPGENLKGAVQLHSVISGAGDPLIVLHGLFGSLDNWAPINSVLAKRYRVFAVDQRNHGHSPQVEEMDYPLMARDLAEFMDAQKLEKAVLLGHSMGGKTAMQFALLHPKRVAKLVVVDISTQAYPPRHNAIFRALLPLELSAFQNRKEIEAALAAGIPSLAVRRFLLKSLAFVPDRGFQWRLGLAQIHKNYAALGEAIQGETPFQGPALFVRGENSEYLREQDLPKIRELFPRAEMKTVPPPGIGCSLITGRGFCKWLRSFSRLCHKRHATPPGAECKSIPSYTLRTAG
jgi:esterase